MTSTVECFILAGICTGDLSSSLYCFRNHALKQSYELILKTSVWNRTFCQICEMLRCEDGKVLKQVVYLVFTRCQITLSSISSDNLWKAKCSFEDREIGNKVCEPAEVLQAVQNGKPPSDRHQV